MAQHLPDYRGGSIVNLMATLAARFGADPGPYPVIDELYRRLLGAPRVALVVIDGLGDQLVRAHPASHMHRGRLRALTSVFPSTTASAITSFATASGPQQHAVTGWFTYLKEMGTVATILPFTPRHRGPTFATVGVSPEQVVGVPPLAARIDAAATHIAPAYIIDSDYTRTSAGPARRLGYDSAARFWELLEREVRAPEPGFVFAYWTELDALAHRYGSASPEVEAQFLALDEGLAALARTAGEAGTVLLVSADHGLVDTRPEALIDLEAHPFLQRCLTLPLCGEPRAAYCYVRANRARDFERYIAAELSQACDVVPSEAAISEGWFGLGTPDPRLFERTGDYILLPRGEGVIRDRLLNESAFTQRGVHGGLSATEMQVPLIGFWPA